MSEEHQAPPPAADDAGAAVEKWFNDTFPGSIVAQNTDVWNFVRDAVEKLKTRLKSRG